MPVRVLIRWVAWAREEVVRSRRVVKCLRRWEWRERRWEGREVSGTRVTGGSVGGAGDDEEGGVSERRAEVEKGVRWVEFLKVYCWIRMRHGRQIEEFGSD